MSQCDGCIDFSQEIKMNDTEPNNKHGSISSIIGPMVIGIVIGLILFSFLF